MTKLNTVRCNLGSGERNIFMEKLRIGIIGCGGIANGKHMPALKKLPNVEMVAFCDIIEERAAKAKAQFGTPDALVCTDYKTLLEDKTIDVVHVCTPNRSHMFTFAFTTITLGDGS